MNTIKRLALAAFAASIILIGVSPAALNGAVAETEGNFNPTAALDTSQVEPRSSDAEMFCFDEIGTTDWICFDFANIPDEYAANNYDRAVWVGPASQIKDAYERLGS